MKWILIIVLHGWGSGVGSTGNAIATADFTTEEKCQLAAEKAIKEAAPTQEYGTAMQAICVEK
jgi:hypothetical protein